MASIDRRTAEFYPQGIDERGRLNLLHDTGGDPSGWTMWRLDSDGGLFVHSAATPDRGRTEALSPDQARAQGYTAILAPFVEIYRDRMVPPESPPPARP